MDKIIAAVLDSLTVEDVDYLDQLAQAAFTVAYLDYIGENGTKPIFR